MKRNSWWAGILLSLLVLAASAGAAKLSWTIENAAGEPQSALALQLKGATSGTVVATTGSGTIIDNGDGSYITSGDLPSGEYSVYSGSGSGTLVPALAYLAHIDPDDLTAVRPINQGGTNSATAAGARTNLGLQIGLNVQAWSPDLDLWNTMSSAARAGGINAFPYYNTALAGWYNASASTFRDLLGVEIGSDVQAYDANLTTLAAGGSAARSFLGLAIGTNVQAYDADLTTLGAGGSAARSFLGLTIGTNVQAWDGSLDQLASVPGDLGGFDGFVVHVEGDGIRGETPSSARAMLGLGSAATLDASDAGDSGAVVRYTNQSGGGGIKYPVRTSHLTPSVSTLGITYEMHTGNQAAGSWGIYTIGRTGTGGLYYTYAVETIVEKTW